MISPEQINLPPNNPIWSYKTDYNPNEGMKMEWISVKDGHPIEDDSVFLVINAKIQMLPIKAYYCEEWNEFMSLENGDGANHPLSVTHWMPLPIPPK